MYQKYFKALTYAILTLFLLTTIAQAWDLMNIVKDEADRRAKKAVKKTVNKAFDATEEKIGDAVTGKKDKQKEQSEDAAPSNAQEPTAEKTEPAKSATPATPTEGAKVTTENRREATLKLWTKYDFVPGNEIIFEDDLAEEEETEFPSRWDLLEGQAAVGLLGNDKVIYFAARETVITPLMEEKSYMPEQFTIEFDIYFDKYFIKHNTMTNAFYLSLGKEIDKIRLTPLEISINKIKQDIYRDKKKIKPGWRHLAISFNKRSLKIYVDQSRILNIPNIKSKPVYLKLKAYHLYEEPNRANIYIKNIRIAKGGSKKLYKRLITDGKIISRGILFDSGKSTILPESMGVINNLVKLLNNHPEVRLSIEGHTDSVGKAAANLKLSLSRANAVKTLLVKSGIDASRLETKGFGESKPTDSNDSPEGRANNRRVEFVNLTPPAEGNDEEE